MDVVEEDMTVVGVTRRISTNILEVGEGFTVTTPKRSI